MVVVFEMELDVCLGLDDCNGEKYLPVLTTIAFL